jgi:hypothetical protein
MIRRLAWSLLLLLIPAPAPATEKLLDSDSPYWDAGKRSPILSRACAVGRFNESQIGRYIIRLHAKKGGAAVLGVAKGTGINLVDLDHIGKVNEDYFFKDDGTSNCEVFVGGSPPKEGAGSVPTPTPTPTPTPEPTGTPAPAPATPP